jgi:AcrR family transcriptional regulator
MKKKTIEIFEQTPRRSQEERSNATQVKILSATTEILFTEGYAAATTQRIASRAGVSRGAMLHHFPAKVDLMLAALRSAQEADAVYLREQLERIERPFDRITALPELTWKVLSGPSGIAVLEIMMASRSDPDLARSLEPVQTQIEAGSQQRVAALMRAAGIRVDARSRELVVLVVAAIRGLSIQAMFRKGSHDTPPALRVLQSLVQAQLLPLTLHRATAAGTESRLSTPFRSGRSTRP